MVREFRSTTNVLDRGNVRNTWRKSRHGQKSRGVETEILALQRGLNYLRDYSTMERRCVCILYLDFAPQSFQFEWFYKPSNPNWEKGIFVKMWMAGGLIYHAGPDGPRWGAHT